MSAIPGATILTGNEPCGNGQKNVALVLEPIQAMHMATKANQGLPRVARKVPSVATNIASTSALSSIWRKRSLILPTRLMAIMAQSQGIAVSRTDTKFAKAPDMVNNLR